MRYRKTKGGLTVNAIAGTHVVFFGLDLRPPANRSHFRGFGFKRLDGATGEARWMRGKKTFEKTAPHPSPTESFSTRDHPVQSFQWADYSAKPGHEYTYTIVALYGDPAALEPRITLEIPIRTEVEDGPVQSVYFNRGSIATQEYANRFQNRKPSVVGQAAYDWLSRGLKEALIRFLGRATRGWEIHGAVYEFQWPDVLRAIREAKNRGAKVRILYDGIEAYDSHHKPKGPWKRNREAIAAAKIKSLCIGRANGKIDAQ